jgi:hypothetical protein
MGPDYLITAGTLIFGLMIPFLISFILGASLSSYIVSEEKNVEGDNRSDAKMS